MAAIGEARSAGKFRDALRHRAWRAQRHVHLTIQVVTEPTRDHRTAVTHPDVVRV
jgi:hypothetical protein